MNTFTRFLYEFLSQFLSGFIIFFKGIIVLLSIDAILMIDFYGHTFFFLI